MIDLFVLWEKFIGRVNTSQNGAVRPHRQFVHWANDISLLLFEEKFKDWENSEKNIDALARPFLISVNLPVQDRGASDFGTVTLPKDYAHFSSLRGFTQGEKFVPMVGAPICDYQGNLIEKTEERPAKISDALWEILNAEEEARLAAEDKPSAEKVKEVTIEKITNSRWGSAMNHRFLKPTLAAPKATDIGSIGIDKITGLKVAPSGVGIVILDYLRRPVPATFLYDTTPGDPLTGEGDEVIYDKEKSLPLEWSELIINEFLDRLIKNYGQTHREQFMFETGEADRRINP